MKNTRYITWCAVFCALGALLPQAFHIFGAAAGQVLLPMHIPAMAAGFLLGPLAGGITGVVSPLLSNLITGGSMPILIKVPFMMVEVAAYGVFCGIFSRKVFANTRLPEPVSVVLSVLAAQAAGRAVNIICTMFAVNVLGVTNKAVSVAAAAASIVSGIPGIIIQLIFIPALVVVLSKIAGTRVIGARGK